MIRVLDLSAGNRAVWFNKAHQSALYVDCRPEVKPDIVADTRALPIKSGDHFDLIVFDPPHKDNGASGNMARNYGHHRSHEIRDIIVKTAGEAFRVSAPKALMAFKWNEHSKSLKLVLGLLDPYWEPLFGHGVSHQQHGTSWVMLRRRLKRYRGNWND